MATSACPQCGARVARDATEFCPDCGFYLTWAETPAREDTDAGGAMTRRPDEEPTEPQPVTAQPPADDQPTTVIGPACPSCREPNPPRSRYCARCGAQLAPEPDHKSEPPRKAPVWALVAGGAVVVALVVFTAVGLWEPDTPTAAEDVADAADEPVAEEDAPDDPTPDDPEVRDSPDVGALRLPPQRRLAQPATWGRLTLAPAP